MKKYSFAFIALVFALASAFAFKPNFATFQFNGDSTDPDERVDPMEYSVASPGCETTDVELCSITAANNGSGKPVINEEDESGLYEALWNNESLSGPDFTHGDVEGKE